MSFFKNILLMSLVLLFVSPLFAETNIESTAKHRAGFSLGVDDFPWNANEVSLRWWQENGKGKELAVDRFYLSIDQIASTETETRKRTTITFPNIKYYFLSRSHSSFSEDIYFIRGFGLGLGFDINLITTEYPAQSTRERTNTNDYWSSFSFYIPIGIEHFFWEKFPNVSYSIGFDLYGSIQLNYRSQQQIFREPQYEIWQKSKGGSLNFGMSSPKFFIRWCF